MQAHFVVVQSELWRKVIEKRKCLVKTTGATKKGYEPSTNQVEVGILWPMFTDSEPVTSFRLLHKAMSAILSLVPSRKAPVGGSFLVTHVRS